MLTNKCFSRGGGGGACARSNMCEKYALKASIWYPVNSLSVWGKGEKIREEREGKDFFTVSPNREPRFTGYQCSRRLGRLYARAKISKEIF